MDNLIFYLIYTWNLDPQDWFTSTHWAEVKRETLDKDGKLKPELAQKLHEEYGTEIEKWTQWVSNLPLEKQLGIISVYSDMEVPEYNALTNEQENIVYLYLRYVHPKTRYLYNMSDIYMSIHDWKDYTKISLPQDTFLALQNFLEVFEKDWLALNGN